MRYILLLITLLLCISCADYDSIGMIRSGDEKFKIICLEGHSYYLKVDVYQGFLSIKLDDNGKPVKCK